MSARRIVVIGASAGGIEAVRTLVAGLPDMFSPPICIVVHTAPASPGIMAEILGRETGLTVSLARDGCRLKAGHIYLAAPGRHVLLEPGRVRVTKGPTEHRFRPAIDPLFRSAAQVFGPAAIGVVLTGNLDDGTAGLWTIKKLGGVAIVQDPREAMCPSMPRHASEHVKVDYVAPLARIPSLLTELIAEPMADVERVAAPELIDVEIDIASERNPRDSGVERIGTPSPYACPDCHGVLLQLEEGGRPRFRCHIGHAYSADSLLAAMNEATGHATGTAIRSIEEGRLLLEQMASRLELRDEHEGAARLRESSNRARHTVTP
jgi:two-component system chemotaxis response regulator CheB